MNRLLRSQAKWHPAFPLTFLASALSIMTWLPEALGEPWEGLARQQPASSAVASAQDHEVLGILRPTDQSVLESNTVEVVARTQGELLLDGKPVSGGPTLPLLHKVVLQLSAGRHELVWTSPAVQHRIQIFVAIPGSSSRVPAGWRVYKAHPPEAECQTCHAIRDGKQVFKTAQHSETCLTCHDLKAFVGAHAHNDEVLADCVLCHNPHGSSERFHLKMSRDLACKQCHG